MTPTTATMISVLGVTFLGAVQACWAGSWGGCGMYLASRGGGAASMPV